MRIDLDITIPISTGMPDHQNNVVSRTVTDLLKRVDPDAAAPRGRWQYYSVSRLQPVNYSKIPVTLTPENYLAGEPIASRRFSLTLLSMHPDMVTGIEQLIRREPWINLNLDSPIRGRVTRIAIARQVLPEHHQVRAISGITAYHKVVTAPRRNREEYYRYLNPQDFEWSGAIIENLKRRAVKLGLAPELIEPLNGQVVPLMVRKRVTWVGRLAVEAYPGDYELRLPEPLLSIALASGLGGKTTDGFGCIIPEKSRSNPGRKNAQAGLKRITFEKDGTAQFPRRQKTNATRTG